MQVRQLPPKANLEQYKKQAKDLLAAGKAADESYTLAKAQLSLARDHGFESWPRFAKHIAGLKDGAVLEFESAADAVIQGDLDTLRSLLHRNPQLAKARSTREHRATLLHYTSANGVEDFRQKSPPKAVEVAKLLLDSGAEVDATSSSYGEDSDTTLDMLVSSVHPANAGVQAPLVELLIDYGAAINGPRDDGSPLVTALAFHSSDAADALARRGARIDNIATAAALGRDDLVGQMLVDGNTLKAGVPLIRTKWLRIPSTAKANIDLALAWAGMFGRTSTVKLLLERGMDPDGRDHRRWTGLHWAAFYRHLETVDAFLEWGAQLELTNEFGATVLGQTVWAAVHSEQPGEYSAVFERLLGAGARLDSAGFPTGIDVVDAMLERHGGRS
jgi:ankyrin repeat protein